MAIKVEEKEFILVERRKYEAMESRDKGVFKAFFTIQIQDRTKGADNYTRYMLSESSFWTEGPEIKILDVEDVVKNIQEGINDGIYIAERKTKDVKNELKGIRSKWWYKLFNKL